MSEGQTVDQIIKARQLACKHTFIKPQFQAGMEFCVHCGVDKPRWDEMALEQANAAWSQHVGGFCP